MHCDKFFNRSVDGLRDFAQARMYRLWVGGGMRDKEGYIQLTGPGPVPQPMHETDLVGFCTPRPCRAAASAGGMTRCIRNLMCGGLKVARCMDDAVQLDSIDFNAWRDHIDVMFLQRAGGWKQAAQ